jgi:hypothetical protein
MFFKNVEKMQKKINNQIHWLELKAPAAAVCENPVLA